MSNEKTIHYMLGDLTIQDIEDVLQHNTLGRLGCADGDTVYVVPVNYAYDGRYIIAHSTEGQKVQMMRKKPGVCFLVDEMQDMANWKSVIVWGQFEEVTDELEKQKAMETLWQKMLKLKVSETALPPHAFGKRPRARQAGYVKVVIWRIDINKKTGRFERN